jgi:hypothetical protein
MALFWQSQDCIDNLPGLTTTNKADPKASRLLGSVYEFVTLELHSQLAGLFDLELPA